MAKKKTLAVFNPHTLERIGLITKYTSCLFTRKSKDVGSFELWCDLDENNVEMTKDGNLIYLSEKQVGIVQFIQEQVNDDGTKSLNVKGKAVKYYMSYRIIIGTYEAYNKHVSDIMNELVDKNFINPTDSCRVLENLRISSESQVGVGPKITTQQTGGEVLEELDTLANSYSFCYDVFLNEKESKLEFKAYQGVNRTINQNDVTPVIVSTNLKDILNTKYVKNSQDEKNVALVAGAGEGSTRKTLMVGTLTLSGVDRKEMYVDARDLSTTSEDEQGNTINLTDEEYNLLLQSRGDSKMSEQKVVESFDAQVRTAGHLNCVYGIDYFLGDTVTAVDEKLGVVVDAEVTEEQEVYSGTDGYTLNITFGYGQPTIVDKLKMVNKEAKSSTSVSDVLKDVQDKIEDGTFVGPQGEPGKDGQVGQRGSRWSAGTAITGTSMVAMIFNTTGITDALINDMYLNIETGNVYCCTKGGKSSVAEWVYTGCIKGPIGPEGSDGQSGTADTTFEIAENVTNLESGEPFKTMLGKIAKAIGTLIDHISKKASTSEVGHVKLSDSSAVTDSVGLALPATEKNASIKGTLANQISAIKYKSFSYEANGLTAYLRKVGRLIDCYIQGRAAQELGTASKYATVCVINDEDFKVNPSCTFIQYVFLNNVHYGQCQFTTEIALSIGYTNNMSGTPANIAKNEYIYIHFQYLSKQ